MSEPLLLWRVSPHYAVRSNEWEDGFSVFHSGSGDTHLLDHLTGQVLSSLLRQPMRLDDLARCVAGQELAQLDESTTQALVDALASLHRVYLIEPSPL